MKRNRFTIAHNANAMIMDDPSYQDFIKNEMNRSLFDSIITNLDHGEKIVSISDYEFLQTKYKWSTEIRQYIEFTDFVRCKDCSHYNPVGSWCFHLSKEMAKNDFCSRGERIEQEGEDGE